MYTGLFIFIRVPNPLEEPTGSDLKPTNPTTPTGLHHQKPILADWVLVVLP